jgi:hypothetical protein
MWSRNITLMWCDTGPCEEVELARSREREEREARRADVLLAEVARLKETAAGAAAGGAAAGAAGSAAGAGGGGGQAAAGLTGTLHGIHLGLVPANPPPSYRLFQPVFGQVKESRGGVIRNYPGGGGGV